MMLPSLRNRSKASKVPPSILGRGACAGCCIVWHSQLCKQDQLPVSLNTALACVVHCALPCLSWNVWYDILLSGTAESVDVAASAHASLPHLPILQ
jgi:hypothetical protein